MKKLSAIFLSAILTTNLSINTYANEESVTNIEPSCLQQCAPVINAADAYINELQMANEQMSELNKYIMAENESYRTTIDLIESEKNVWYKNPMTMGLLGIVVGVVGGQAIK